MRQASANLARLFLVALFAITTIGPATAQPKPFVLDAILSLTGTAAALGQDEAAGLAAYEKVVNRTGGLRGQPVHFEVVDDQSNSSTAVQLATAILAKHPVAVIGSTLAGPSQAMAPLFKNGPVLYATTPLIAPDKGSYIFGAGAQTRYNMLTAMRYFRMKGLTKFTFITTTDASGQDYARVVDYALSLDENKNVTVLDRETFNVADISIAALITHVKAANPQAIIAYATGTPFGTVLQGLSSAGIDVPIITAGVNFNPVLLERFKTYLPKAEMVVSVASFFNRNRGSSDQLKAPIDEFYQALDAAGLKPNAAYAYTWDPARIIISGLRKLGPNATPEQLREYIANLRGFAGVSGIYDFGIGDQHGLTQDSQLVVRFDPNVPGGMRVVSQQGGAPL
jgi:branched-chain amino acid transport system substrate-binding protein